MKNKLMPTIILGSICLVAALLLSVINLITAPEIARRQEAEAYAALLEVLPDGEGFEQIALDEVSLDAKIASAWAATKSGGYVFQLKTSGKYDGIIIMIGVDEDGKIAGTKCIENKETAGYASKVFSVTEDGYYVGQDSASFNPYVVSGSTMTSEAYSGAVKAALDAYGILKGGN